MLGKKWLDDNREVSSYCYSKLENFSSAIEDFKTQFTTELEKIDAIIQPFLEMGGREAEVYATTYAAWQNVLLQKGDSLDETIVREVMVNWKGKAKRFEKDETVYQAIQWLRKKNLIPTETGTKSRRDTCLIPFINQTNTRE